MLATRLAGERNAGRVRRVSVVQVVRDAPQVTQSCEQPLSASTAVIGFRNQPCIGSAPARSRCRSTMPANTSGLGST